MLEVVVFYWLVFISTVDYLPTSQPSTNLITVHTISFCQYALFLLLNFSESLTGEGKIEDAHAHAHEMCLAWICFNSKLLWQQHHHQQSSEPLAAVCVSNSKVKIKAKSTPAKNTNYYSDEWVREEEMVRKMIKLSCFNYKYYIYPFCMHHMWHSSLLGNIFSNVPYGTSMAPLCLPANFPYLYQWKPSPQVENWFWQLLFHIFSLHYHHFQSTVIWLLCFFYSESHPYCN